MLGHPCPEAAREGDIMECLLESRERLFCGLVLWVALQAWGNIPEPTSGRQQPNRYSGLGQGGLPFFTP